MAENEPLKLCKNCIYSPTHEWACNMCNYEGDRGEYIKRDGFIIIGCTKGFKLKEGINEKSRNDEAGVN